MNMKLYSCRRLAFGSLLVAALVPLAAAQAQPVRSLIEIRRANVIVQEWDTSCGAAALATVLTYQLGHPVSEKQVATGMLRRGDPLKVRHRGGFSLLDMKRYAEGSGFVADGYAKLSAAQLLKLAPAIVPMKLDGYDHFVVFRGIVRGQVLLADPAFGNRNISFAQFENEWNGRIAFVVQNKGASAPNRIAPKATELLAVQDESVRAGLEAEPLPRQLRDFELARISFDGLPALTTPMTSAAAGSSMSAGAVAGPALAAGSPAAASAAAPIGTTTASVAAPGVTASASSAALAAPSLQVSAPSAVASAPAIPAASVSTTPSIATGSLVPGVSVSAPGVSAPSVSAPRLSTGSAALPSVPASVPALPSVSLSAPSLSTAVPLRR